MLLVAEVLLVLRTMVLAVDILVYLPVLGVVVMLVLTMLQQF